jgi:hypothetical protein
MQFSLQRKVQMWTFAGFERVVSFLDPCLLPYDERELIAYSDVYTPHRYLDEPATNLYQTGNNHRIMHDDQVEWINT